MKTPAPPSAEDDLELFQHSMQGVTPLQDRQQADTGKRPRNRISQARLRQRAQQAAQQTRVDGLSDQFVLDVTAEEFLLWKASGLQESQLRRLKAGQIPFEGSLDLHGYSIEKARELLWDFLAEAVQLEVRCVRVTHGKSARLDGRRPLLKSHVNTWLRQHERVLGFSSCLPRHGGTGALYVLLRRTMLDGRDES